MLGPDYELVLSDGGKCMEVRNCSEDDVCMASLLTYTHTQTHTHRHTHTSRHTQTHTHTHTHTRTHTHTQVDTHTPIYRMHSIGTIYHVVSPKDQPVKRRYIVWVMTLSKLTTYISEFVLKVPLKSVTGDIHLNTQSRLSSYPLRLILMSRLVPTRILEAHNEPCTT